MDKQTRIFVPIDTPAYPPSHWYENILGRIIKPITDQHQENLDWFWFSKYVHVLSDNSISEDCNVNEIIPPFVGIMHDNITASIRFRYSINDNARQAFEDTFDQLIQAAGCFKTDFRHWGKTADVGSGRHIGGVITPARQERRAEINTGLYHQISLLMLDALEGPNAKGNFTIEINNTQHDPPRHERQAPSSFHTPHHVFCNITGATFPMWVSVTFQNGQMHLKTQTGYGSSDDEHDFPIDIADKPMIAKF